MSILEDRLRDTMTEMADEVRPVPMLPRLQHTQTGRHAQRRIYRVAAIAAAIIAALVAGSLILLRAGDPRIIEPVDRPPKVFRLGAGATAAPGTAQLAVSLAPNTDGEADTYVVGPGGGPATLVPNSRRLPRSYARHLTADGTRLILQNDDAANPRLEIVNLRTGSRDRLGGTLGYCPQLSPDHRTVVSWRPADHTLSLLDTRSLSVRRGPFDPTLDGPDPGAACTGIAWSPDGRRLAVPMARGSFVGDLRGQVLHRMLDRYAVNGSMSWSPDGRALLLYDKKRGRFVVHDVATGRESSLGTPRERSTPIGWAGSRVVWLAGRPGHQRLVTTDQSGQERQTWTRFEVGNRVVDSISWSRRLAGTAR